MFDGQPCVLAVVQRRGVRTSVSEATAPCQIAGAGSVSSRACSSSAARPTHATTAGSKGLRATPSGQQVRGGMQDKAHTSARSSRLSGAPSASWRRARLHCGLSVAGACHPATVHCVAFARGCIASSTRFCMPYLAGLLRVASPLGRLTGMRIGLVDSTPDVNARRVIGQQVPKNLLAVWGIFVLHDFARSRRILFTELLTAGGSSPPRGIEKAVAAQGGVRYFERARASDQWCPRRHSWLSLSGAGSVRVQYGSELPRESPPSPHRASTCGRSRETGARRSARMPERFRCLQQPLAQPTNQVEPRVFAAPDVGALYDSRPDGLEA